MEDKEFLDQIKDTLHNWQEPYEAGAWEDFSQEQRKRRGIFILWRYAGAAAILLLLGLPFLWHGKQSDNNYAVHKPHLPNKAKQHSEPVSQSESQHLTEKFNKNQTAQVSATVIGKAIKAHKPDGQIGKSYAGLMNNYNQAAAVSPQGNHAVSKNTITDSLDNKQPPNSQSRKDQSILAGTPIKRVPENTHSLYDSLTKKNNPVTSDKTTHNLAYAVALHPAISNNKLNFGAAFEVSYPLNEHLAIGSGIGYASLRAETDGDSGTGTRQLQSSDIEINGIELPVSLKYNVKNGFYLNAGISAVALLNNQVASNYIITTTHLVAAANPNSGSPQQVLQVASEKTKEQTTESLNHYLGFYTLSVGKKQAWGKKQFDLGPFVKIPFNPVSSQNVKFTQAGFRLGFSF